MTEQYFTQKPQSGHDERMITDTINNIALKFKTDRGVFSKGKVDYGSKLLIETFITQADIKAGDRILELGSGYGPVVIALAKSFPEVSLTGIEVNERALHLAQENAKINQVNHIEWQLADVTEVEFEKVYQHVLTNPPIRAGKLMIQRFVTQAHHALDLNGSLWLVIQKKQGAPSMRKHMETIFGNVERVALNRGYWILKSQKKE